VEAACAVRLASWVVRRCRTLRRHALAADVGKGGSRPRSGSIVLDAVVVVRTVGIVVVVIIIIVVVIGRC
jgi:hypothetical protein